MTSPTINVAQTPPTAEMVSGGGRFFKRIIKQRTTVLALLYVVAFIFIGIFADVLAPYDPMKQNFSAVLETPSLEHWLGTDNLGRDSLSRILHGARIAFWASSQAILIAIVLGVPLGLLSGYVGGWFDRILMGFNDTLLSLPGLMVAFGIIAVIGASLSNAMIAVGIIFSTRYLRLTRGVVLAEREQLYIAAAQVTGVSVPSLLFSHILPNIASPLIVQTSVLFGAVILIESSLSFLGLGASVGIPSWGGMLNEARLDYARQPFLALPPGFAIMFTVLAFNLLGDGIQDALAGRESLANNPQPPKPIPTVSVVTDASPQQGYVADEPRKALVLQDLEVRFPSPYGDMSVVSGVNLHLNVGETVGLVGESGSGKSITAKAIMGLIPPPGQIVSGSLKLNGQELFGSSHGQWQEIRGKRIAMIFQEPLSALDPTYKVGDQIAEPLRQHYQLSHKQALTRATELLDLVGVPEPHRRIHDYPHQFSGGMAQRVVIARALSCEPDILIADEPTTALDVTIQGQVLDLLRDLQSQFGMAMLFITHDLGVVADICDRALVMYAGQIVESATCESLMLRPRHPYTAALLGAIPQNQKRIGELANIRGQVPQPWNLPTGCRFHPRCSFAHELCSSQSVALSTIDVEHQVRCLRAEELQQELRQ
ncbi:MAG: dipeptide/oligopeptide/nickel ABC transporter permease/ATP-binding protein [Phototrophicaceae bacterium]